MPQSKPTIQEELLDLLSRHLTRPVTVSRPVRDDVTGSYFDTLCRCVELGGPVVLKDGANGDNNPCVLPVSQMSATGLVRLLEDTVRAGRDSLLEDYSGFVGKDGMCDWADDAVRLLHLERRVNGLGIRKVACRHIHDRLCLLVQWANWEKGRVPEIRFRDWNGGLRLFRDLPYILHLDTFAGLCAEGVSVVEALTVEEVRDGRFGVALSLSGEGGPVTHASVTKEDIILYRDHDWMPDESLLSLEDLVNSFVRADGLPLDEDVDLAPGENENNGLACIDALLKGCPGVSRARYDAGSDTLSFTLAADGERPRSVSIHQFADLGYYTLHVDDPALGPSDAAGMYDGRSEPHGDIAGDASVLPSPKAWPWLARLFDALDGAGYNPAHVEVELTGPDGLPS